METLHFSVSGEFVTRTAREWYLEGKPWETIEDFLLQCMCGTDQSRDELVKLAHGVVEGRYKFTGNTADDTFGLEEDDAQQEAGHGEKAEKPEPYGWLSPKGEYFPVPFGHHEEFAIRKCEKFGYCEYKERGYWKSTLGVFGDTLVAHGWVMLDNPGYGDAIVTKSQTRPLTKAQREFLFDYMTVYGRHEEAKEYMED